MNSKDKIILADYILEDLVDRRKDMGLSAYALSEKLEKSKFWISNFENKKVKYIAREDLKTIYSFFFNDSNFDVNQYLDKLQQKNDAQLKGSWLKTGNVLPKYIDTNTEDDILDIYEDLIDEFKDESAACYEYSLQSQKIFVSALSELCTSLQNDPDLTTLMMSIPLSVTQLLSPEERYALKKDLLRLYQKCTTLFDEKIVEKQHTEELDALQKQNLQFIGNTLLMKVQEFNSIQSMDDSYAEYNIQFLRNILETLTDIRPIFDRNLSFDSLDVLFTKCLEHYSKICTKYDITSSIPENPLTTKAHSLLKSKTIENLSIKTEPSE